MYEDNQSGLGDVGGREGKLGYLAANGVDEVVEAVPVNEVVGVMVV